ncbi:MAPEG family protein [Pseudoalteromonas sp. McH1-7]|uniref:MAPEG family protein n=1 Tax=Pseudoalteromonas TaxID=53246 RepID=UPI000F64C48E|nr:MULTISPECIES: MAPEG family protein [Pseudoalteromonas]MDW7550538.1 MAPEG family protein [Pseudoalteromonas peptidolytica]NUZ09253.1 MAPEG family protein [Pseudoalteromonas sp. McH1-7]RRS06803.1 glutathione metabolism protein [Pseudoalteromonas sp. J010]RXE95813.1 glutathione metabolism protein [Pseudoalteromonas sp. PS5]USD30035.1 MAPEG family protein [Pseudoalteromonas sp. SCSIO 43201]
MITGLYAALLALLYIKLSFNIISLRHKHKISLGDGDIDTLRSAIRIHANFIEYTPFVLIMMLLLELQDISALFVHILGAAFVFSRVAHFIALQRNNFSIRKVSMATTYGVILTLSLSNLYLYFI